MLKGPETETIELVGDSPQMQTVLAGIRKIAATDVPVLLVGEKGTGKRTAGRMIHQHSSRVKGPFTLVNCDSVPANLTEVEFFGHTKGEFTGAYTQGKGYVELSHGGTLFLENIDALPMSLQAYLARSLEERSIVRIGAREETRVDVRLIGTTEKDLKQAVEKGQFRDDLYFGLVAIPMPPLRTRTEDILPLAQGFLKTFAQQNGKMLVGFVDSAEHAMRAYSWPGNVRELESRVRRAVVMADRSSITTEDLELAEAQATPQKPRLTLREARAALEREMIIDALTSLKGNVSQAAKQLGISRPALHELIAKHNLPRR